MESPQKAYAEMRQSGPEIAQARAARDAARKYYDEMAEHVLRTDPNGAAMQQRLDEIDEEDELAQAQQRGLAEEIAAVRQAVEKADSEIVAARKEYEQARAKHDEVMKKRSGAEAKMLADAKDALEKRLRDKAATDPMLLSLQEQLQKAEDEINALGRRRQELYREHEGKRRRKRD